MATVVRHVVDHWFHGVCICSCKDCTQRVGGRLGAVRCICPACPSAACGLKTARIV